MHHPNVLQFIEQFEREAARKGLYRNKLGELEVLFLDLVWGPAMNWNFQGLSAEYPFKDFKGGLRFADYVYLHHGLKLLMELDGFTTHARNISPGEFDDHLTRQNDMILSGWLLLRFSSNQISKHPEVCQRQIKQAIGHWWSLTQGMLTAKDADMWTLRRQYVIHLAHRGSGEVTPTEVAQAFEISRVSAVNWLKFFVEEGFFAPVGQGLRVRKYALVNHTGNPTK